MLGTLKLDWLLPADISEAVQSFTSPQVNVSVGQRRGGIAALSQIVDGDNFPVGRRFQNGNFPFFAREKQLPFGRDRRRRVAAQGARNPARLCYVASGRIE